MRAVNSNFNKSLSILMLLCLLNLTACTGLFNTKLFKERAAETPPPSEQTVDKSFFVDASGKPKTFLCAIAPEVGRGWTGESYLYPGVNDSPHCNVEFEITESFLVGKMINPSFLNDRARWIEFIRIPIAKHFYYERAKDEHGRDTNNWIENDSRSHWSARPRMRLTLSGIQFGDATSSAKAEEGSAGRSFQISSVEDVEWDLNSNFLGFSINTVYTTSEERKALSFQGKFRVNFLKFDHDPSFKKIAYNQENSKFMNILHVMGRMVDGVEPELYAAHWDLRKTTKVYLSGVPPEQQQTVANAIYRWNKELRKVGAIGADHDAFEPIIKDLKHPFDLRYPSITWISDRRLSMNAPLGIGMAHADVRNGQILWGGVVLWGGMLQRYINSYSPTESDGSGETAAQATGPGANSDNGSPFDSIMGMIPPNMPAVDALGVTAQANRSQKIASLGIDYKNYMSDEMARLGLSKSQKDKEKLDALRAQLQALHSEDPKINSIIDDAIQSSRTESLKVTDYFKHMNLANLLSTNNPNAKGLTIAERAKKAGNGQMVSALGESDLSKRAQMLRAIGANGMAMFTDTDLNIQNKIAGWTSAQKVRNYPKMLESVVMSLTIHEFGHFIGLGHQFKENIIPEPGTVPSKYISALAAKATPQAEFTNMTSVMGYQSGRTEMMMDVNDIYPGPHDNLVLHYLYKGEYSTYDVAKDDFKFLPVPESGRIPEFTKVEGTEKPLRVSYFPACNDWEASLGADPFCNRWDRGSSAVDIVNSYFDSINDNLLTNLYSVVGGGGNSWGAEYRMWNISLDTFSRVRMFYDEMRRRLRSDPHLAPWWNQLRTDQAALFEFATACNKPNPTDPLQVHSSILLEIFKDQHIVDLCRANGMALDQFSFFLNLPDSDYTKIDQNNRYVQGGYLAGDVSHNFSYIFGSWYQLSNLALKFSALYTLTAANSYILWGGIAANPFYDSEENRFLYRTLYPMKYTKVIADTVQNNMRFAATGKDDTTTMGRAVLAAGSMVPHQHFTSNDSARLPRGYNDLLDQQTQFKFSIVAILIDAAPPDSNSNVADRYKKFTATIYDLMTGKNTNARSVYILPKGDVFVWGNRMFIYPITKLKFYAGTSAYVIAYKVDYDVGVKDPLINSSLKFALMEQHEAIVATCVNGFNGNGLQNYFDTSKESFAGFKILTGIADEQGNEKLTAFFDSVDEEFAKYETHEKAKIPKGFRVHTMVQVCDEAMRGVGQISAAAAMANGYWLGITSDYVVW